MKNHKIVLNNSMRFSKFIFPVICIFSSIGIMGIAVAEKNRFSPPPFNSALSDFNKRFSSNSVNIEFIVAQVLNNARQIDRAGEDFKNNASLYRNISTGGANAGSVIIPPGTTADTIIIINQNDGDSYAIQR